MHRRSVRTVRSPEAGLRMGRNPDSPPARVLPLSASSARRRLSGLSSVEGGRDALLNPVPGSPSPPVPMDADTITIGNKTLAPEKVLEVATSAANWFRTIGIFSVINAALTLFNAQIVFVIGLGATMVVDGLLAAARMEATGGALAVISVVGYVFEFMLLGSVFLVWHLAR